MKRNSAALHRKGKRWLLSSLRSPHILYVANMHVMPKESLNLSEGQLKAWDCQDSWWEKGGPRCGTSENKVYSQKSTKGENKRCG